MMRATRCLIPVIEAAERDADIIWNQLPGLDWAKGRSAKQCPEVVIHSSLRCGSLGVIPRKSEHDTRML